MLRVFSCVFILGLPVGARYGNDLPPSPLASSEKGMAKKDLNLLFFMHTSLSLIRTRPSHIPNARMKETMNLTFSCVFSSIGMFQRQY